MIIYSLFGNEKSIKYQKEEVPKMRRIKIGFVFFIAAGLVLANLTGCGGARVSSLLKQYEKIADEAIEIINNASEEDFSSMAKLLRLETQIETIAEELAEYADIMTDDQMTKFLEISMKLASVAENLY
jgi:hypothetical protein